MWKWSAKHQRKFQCWWRRTGGTDGERRGFLRRPPWSADGLSGQCCFLLPVECMLGTLQQSSFLELGRSRQPKPHGTCVCKGEKMRGGGAKGKGKGRTKVRDGRGAVLWGGPGDILQCVGGRAGLHDPQWALTRGTVKRGTQQGTRLLAEKPWSEGPSWDPLKNAFKAPSGGRVSLRRLLGREGWQPVSRGSSCQPARLSCSSLPCFSTPSVTRSGEEVSRARIRMLRAVLGPKKDGSLPIS